MLRSVQQKLQTVQNIASQNDIIPCFVADNIYRRHG